MAEKKRLLKCFVKIKRNQGKYISIIIFSAWRLQPVALIMSLSLLNHCEIVNIHIVIINNENYRNKKICFNNIRKYILLNTHNLIFIAASAKALIR